MIKILKPGTRDTRECERCGCLFSFDKEDIKGGNGYVNYVVCPQCENKVTLKQNREMPKDMKCNSCMHVHGNYIQCDNCGSENNYQYYVRKFDND